MLGRLCLVAALIFAGPAQAAVLASGTFTGPDYGGARFLAPTDLPARQTYELTVTLSHQIYDFYPEAFLERYYNEYKLTPDGEVYFGGNDNRWSATPLNKISETEWRLRWFQFGNYGDASFPPDAPIGSVRRVGHQDVFKYLDTPYRLREFGPVDYTITLEAVPEPSTWAMLLLGFGGVGAALRARRPRRSPTIRQG